MIGQLYEVLKSYECPLTWKIGEGRIMAPKLFEESIRFFNIGKGIQFTRVLLPPLKDCLHCKGSGIIKFIKLPESINFKLLVSDAIESALTGQFIDSSPIRTVKRNCVCMEREEVEYD